MIHISASMYRNEAPQALTPELEEQKQYMYDKMSPRRRTFIDKIGYANWDPFQKPNEPMELRQDVTKRTTQELVRQFLQSVKHENYSNEYGKGALECALGIINKDEKYRGILDFCVWYEELLRSEGHV